MGVWGSTLATPLTTTFTTLISILGSSGGCLGLLAFSLLAHVLVTLSFLYVTLVLLLTTFATITTGGGTPEVVLMGQSFPIFGVLLSIHLQHTTTAVVAVRGMTSSPFIIDRLAVEQEHFKVISTLCVCCASPAACCWCMVPAACF